MFKCNSLFAPGTFDPMGSGPNAPNCNEPATVICLDHYDSEKTQPITEMETWFRCEHHRYFDEMTFPNLKVFAIVGPLAPLPK